MPPPMRRRALPRTLPPLDHSPPTPEEKKQKKKQKRTKEDRVNPESGQQAAVHHATSLAKVDAESPFREKLNLEISRVIDILVPRYRQRAKRNFILVSEYGSDLVATARGLTIDFGGTFDEVPTFGVRHAYEFELRVFIRAIPFPGAIQLLDGMRAEVLPGYLAVKLSDSLVPLEKAYLKQQFSHCFDASSYISTAKLVPWFNRVITQAVRIVSDRDEYRQKLEVVECGPVHGRGFLVEIKTESDRIKIFIYPAIRGTGWPKGAMIKDNIPHIAGPFESAATRYKRDIRARLAEGDSFWHLEAKSSHLLSIPSKFSPKMSGRHWSMNFTRYESHLFRDDRQKLKQSASILLEALTEFHHQHWQSIVDDRIIGAVLLMVCKEDFIYDKRNCGELILNILIKFQKCLQRGMIANYFMKNINLLATFQETTVQQVAVEFKDILEEIQRNPEAIRKYFHPQFIDDAPSLPSQPQPPVTAVATAPPPTPPPPPTAPPPPVAPAAGDNDGQHSVDQDPDH